MGKTAIDAQRGTIFMVPPERLALVTDRNNPLYDPRVEDAPDESMVANIAMHGILEPVLVRRNGQAIEVVAGRGRTKAAMEANRRLTTEGKKPLLVPVLIRGGSDADLYGVMIAENEIRRDDTMLSKGAKARKLLHLGYTVPQIAVTFGATRQAVDQWLAAEELPQPIKDAVEAGEIKASAALQLARAGLSRDEQVKCFEEVKMSGGKPTVATMRIAAAATVPETERSIAPSSVKAKMKTRKEIIEKMKEFATEDAGEWEKAYVHALLWVLGKEK